jgi:hypothetical protein
MRWTPEKYFELKNIRPSMKRGEVAYTTIFVVNRNDTEKSALVPGSCRTKPALRFYKKAD